MLKVIIFFLVLTVFYFLIPKSNLITVQDAVPKIPNNKTLNEMYRDIYLEPYGCFTNLKDHFFLKKINPYSKQKVFDSGIIISENETTKDMLELINKVIINGYDIYGNSILEKYSGTDFKHVNIEEIGVLGKLAGYNYLSIYKTNLRDRGKIYLTYSPPMESSITETIGPNYTIDQYNSHLVKSDLPNYTLTPKLNKYTNEQERAPDKELSCGYPCFKDDEPHTFTDSNGEQRQYMCGSVAYPGIKTPHRYSVYHIAERI